MQVRVFSIRLDSNNLEIDQNSLNDFLDTVHFKKSNSHLIEAEESYWSVLVHYENEEERVNEPESPIQTSQPEIILSEKEELIFDRLKHWRNEKAHDLNLPHYMISHNSELKNIAIKKPENKNQLRKIKGFGEVKVEKYSEEILSILNEF
jgi:superfamily II DNA helicase RecQ